MTAPIYYKATYRGKHHTLHTKGWSLLLGRSQTFMYARLSDAEVLKHDNPMQYAVDVSEEMFKTKTRKYKERTQVVRKSPKKAIKNNKEAMFSARIKEHIDNFLYPGNCMLMEKREHVCLNIEK